MTLPILTISLDFELHWGRFDKYPLENCYMYYRNTRAHFPRLLELFAEHQIQATWATVGMLYADNFEEWKYYSPKELPEYRNRNFSAYHWMDDYSGGGDEALYAPDLVKMILDFPGQELGSHTYSHFYTREQGQTDAAFKADLDSAKKIALDKFGLSLSSLVFPRNQFDQNALNIAQQAGFKTYRSNPEDWYWKDIQEETLIKKLFRTGDSLITLGQKSSYPWEPVQDQGMVKLPASRLLRPYRSNSLFNKRRVNRIIDELTQAAIRNEVYHLWWHPHLLGNYPLENLNALERIFRHVRTLKDRYGLISLNMQQTASTFQTA